jgi:hypothetical protein
VFYTIREHREITKQQVDNFRQFVKLYSKFKNDFNLPNSANEAEKNLYELLKKYKLASSEGLKKHTNRMIRFNVLKSFLYGLDVAQIAARKTLLAKMQPLTTLIMTLRHCPKILFPQFYEKH